MGGAVKKIAPIVAIGAAAFTGGASLAALAPAAGAASAAGAAAAGVTAAAGAASAGAFSLGASALGIAGGAAGILGSAGAFLSKASPILSGISNVAGAFAAPAATYAGAQSTAYAARQSSRDQLSSAENLLYQSKVSLINKNVAELNLQFEQQVNYTNTERLKRDNRKTLEKGKTMFALSGVDATGSVQDVLADTAMEGELNVAIANFESKHRQKGYDIQINSFQEESDNYIKASEKAKENAATILKEGLAQSKGETSLSYIKGIEAIPQALSGIKDLSNFIESL